jgi:hypothetical protein
MCCRHERPAHRRPPRSGRPPREVRVPPRRPGFRGRRQCRLGWSLAHRARTARCAASRKRGFVDEARSVDSSRPASGKTRRRRRRTYPRKGTTPARGGGGEGRRESAPGGRADTPSAKPSTAYYTHDSIARRKSCLKLRAWDFGTLCLDLRLSRATETWLTGRFVGHLAVCRTVPLCWGGDRLGLGR